MEVNTLPNSYKLGTFIKNIACCRRETLKGRLPSIKRKVEREESENNNMESLFHKQRKGRRGFMVGVAMAKRGIP